MPKLDQNKFEQQYMEKSWQKGHERSYRKFIVDDSIKKFQQFLKQKGIIKGKLLDIGCGNGKNTIFFDKLGYDSLGIDFTKTAVKLAKDYAKKYHSQAQFKKADILSDKFKKDYNNNEANNKNVNNYKNKININNNSYDIILDCGCLHHLRRKYWPKYFQNILNLSKKGSYYYLHGFSQNCYKLGYVKNNKKFRVKNGHYTCFFSKKEIKALFQKQFRLIKTYEHPDPQKRFIIRVFYFQRK